MNFKVHPNEPIYFSVMVAISLLVYGALCINMIQHPLTAAVYIIYPAIFLTLFLVQSLLLSGHLKGNAIKVSERQFPEAFALLQQHAKALGLSTIPNMYVLQGGGILNAFATRFARKNYIVLYSDVLGLAYKEGIEAVSFIIGHELGHIKRNHVGFIRFFLTGPARLIPFLGNAYSRACEYTCDNIGYSLCPVGAKKGILLLAAGKNLYQYVNVDELLLNEKSVSGFDFWFAQIFSTHPPLIKRLAMLDCLRMDATQATRPFVNPQINAPIAEPKSTFEKQF